MRYPSSSSGRLTTSMTAMTMMAMARRATTKTDSGCCCYCYWGGNSLLSRCFSPSAYIASPPPPRPFSSCHVGLLCLDGHGEVSILSALATILSASALTSLAIPLYPSPFYRSRLSPFASFLSLYCTRPACFFRRDHRLWQWHCSLDGRLTRMVSSIQFSDSNTVSSLHTFRPSSPLVDHQIQCRSFPLSALPENAFTPLLPYLPLGCLCSSMT